MLQGHHVRVRRKGDLLLPQFVDVEAAGALDAAERLMGVVLAAREARTTCGELEEAFEQQIGDDRQVKLLRGLVKLLLDRCAFASDCPLPAPELRRLVFARAAARRPLDLERGAFGRPTAEDVLAEVGAELGLTADALSSALYGDLRQAQVLTEAELPESPRALLERYNVSLVQAILLSAVRVTLRLRRPRAARVRQLLRHVKFQQLMHEARRDGDDLEVVLDGPASLFSKTTRYGLALARLLPAVLLQEGAWSLRADLVWSTGRVPARLELDASAGLRSPARDIGGYDTAEQKWFAERWEALGEVGWTLSHDTEPIELGGRGVVLPDFSFTDGRRVAHLEIVGFWRRGYLERRVEGLVRHGPGNLVLAVSRRLATETEGLDAFEGEVLSFANVVPARDVLAAVERVAR